MPVFRVAGVKFPKMITMEAIERSDVFLRIQAVDVGIVDVPYGGLARSQCSVASVGIFTGATAGYLPSFAVLVPRSVRQLV